MRFTKDNVLRQVQFMVTKENLYRSIARMDEQPLLNDIQQEYLTWLKEEWAKDYKFLNQFIEMISKKSKFLVVAKLSNSELAEVWALFLNWVHDND